jgi:hypothetical protein
MRSFVEITNQYRLKEFLESPSGTMYFNPDAYQIGGGTPIIVRRFNRQWPAALVGPYVDMTQEAQEWIARHPDLARVVRVEQPIEVGQDFVMRRHYSYYVSTRSYIEDDDPPKEPRELQLMRMHFGKARSTYANERDQLIATVLSRSILEPTGKTFFLSGEGRFVVLDLKPTSDELEHWAGLRGTFVG